MSDPLLVDESSVQRNRPIELYDVALPTATYYIASGNRDVMVGSTIYKAVSSQRAAMQLVQVSGNGGIGLELALPIDHAVVTRWFTIGVAPRMTTVTCWRKQERSQLVERRWSGYVTSIAVEDTAQNPIAKLLIPEPVTDAMQRNLPMVLAATSCVHTLFDKMCQLSRATYTVTTTARAVIGDTVHVDLGDPSRLRDWTENGQFTHVPSGETMTIMKQHDMDPTVNNISVLTLQQPILELKTGDAITFTAGCKKGIDVCRLKFNNKDNYGMGPDMPSKNPMVPTGMGTGQQ